MKRLTIRFGGYQKAASIHTRAAVRFGELLNEYAAGQIDFDLVADVLALGRNSGDLPRMVESGELSLCYISTVRFTGAVPELALLELPFVVRDRGALFEALDGALGERFRARMHASTNLMLLDFWDNGFRHLTNKVRPIRRPEDCRGIRIRTQMSALHGEAFRTLGFEPVAADIAEFVNQIATERFQAQDNPLTNIHHFGVHRHHRHITLSGHFFGASALVCNAGHFRAWPDAVKDAVRRAAREATLYQRRLAAAEDEAILSKLDPRENEVVHLSPDERAAFAAAVAPVLARHRASLDPALFRFLE